MPYFALQIIFSDPETAEIRRHVLRNLSDTKFRQFRNDVFITGFVIRDPDFPGTEYELISPFAIKKILVTMQEKKFE